jgi:stearoyl-CoA desaturase (delta-9 desaturase)
MAVGNPPVLKVNRSCDEDVGRLSLLGRYQRRHVFYCNFLPLLGSLLAIGIAFCSPPRLGEWLTLAVMWLIIGAGVTVGYHRYFTHQAFETGPVIRVILAILGSMSAQGPLVAWVATHRRHHQLSDREGDPHSPNLHEPGIRGRISGIGHAVPNPLRYAADILRDPRLKWINRTYYFWVLLGVLLPGLALGIVRRDWQGFLAGCLWGGALRIFFGSQFVWAINSLGHSIGTRPFPTREHSTNNALLALPTCGEAWHNNHHAFPKSACLGHAWWQLDIGYLIIGVLRSMGWVWNVWTPSELQIARARVPHAQSVESDEQPLKSHAG